MTERQAKANEAKADKAKNDDARAGEVKADGAKVDGEKVDGVKVDGVKAGGARADGATADESKADDGSVENIREAPVVESEEALRCMAHPERMRLLGALRVDGVQTVGELSAATGEAPGAVSYHLAQLAKVGLVEKATSPDGDKRKSYWKSCHQATNIRPDSASADVVDAFSRTAALTYQMAYERFLDVLPTLPQEWAQTCGASDRVLWLTAEETRAMAEDLNAVMRKWERLSDARRTTMAPADPARGAAAQAKAEAGAEVQAAEAAAKPVAVVQQVFRWVP